MKNFIIRIYRSLFRKIFRLHVSLINELLIDELKKDLDHRISNINQQIVVGNKDLALLIEDKYYDVSNILINSIDIEKIPKAKGRLRKLQMVFGFLLRDFDEICFNHGIKYWVNFGTLLGAIRHKGFIPWDDDLDVSMLIEDYRKFIALKKEVFDEKDMILITDVARQIKLQYKTLVPFTSLCLDIYPFYYESITDLKDQKNLAIKIKTCVDEMFRDPTVDTNRQKWIKIVKKYKLNNIKPVNPNERIIYPGMELISYKKPLFSYDDIFPLVRSDFEEFKVNIPNNYTKFLRAFYGDYYSFPKGKLFGLHSNEIDLADENLIKVLKKIMRDKKIVLD